MDGIGWPMPQTIRTFKHEAFLPLRRLVDLKRMQRQKISLVVPARNEEGTIGDIITLARKELHENNTLLDEIVVMDGGSTDATVQRAAQAGADVVEVESVAVEHHAPPGKGTALWKSLFVTKGDIVVCVDADIRNFSERFIYGVLGPLLTNDAIVFVKGAYRRPLVLEGVADENYGGRVTEILVRPLLSAFYPALARLYQPLAGEYAFRREAAERVPFFSGYGVEIGLVMDMYRLWGLEGFAQVDMGVRYHRNRSGVELGRMAFGIMRAVLRRLEDEGRAHFPEEPYNTMISPGLSGWEDMPLIDVELPPVQRGVRGGE
ncbi:MAG: glucosyl-3-phosphoglycerate synthase [Chitinivibrionales bacterium]|nr:glucosyl-3-phosphoglycerate synthase [Chitinivibrionales bacterium]MBD3358663.1 glucosyl-3-phosphoglycerate synthase [Chitinivibrionales bacterium]